MEGLSSQFNVQLTITRFKPGSQVFRGDRPIRMLVATTELTVDATFSDVSTGRSTYQQLTSTVRDDFESRRIADKAARILAKHFSSASKELQNPCLDN